MDVYQYQAALYCPECVDKIKERLNAEGTRPADPSDEHTFDSDDYPKGPYADGGGESDSPQHCGGCHRWLENELTSDGVNYVLERAEDEISEGSAKYNRIMPAKGTGEDDKSFAYWHGSPHKAIVLEWLEDLTNYSLEPAQAARLDRALAILRDGEDPKEYDYRIAKKRTDEAGGEEPPLPDGSQHLSVEEAARHIVDRLLD